MTDIHAEKILILDFGSQYTQLIARRVREIGVYCEIHAHDLALDEIKNFAPKGIILSGGPASVHNQSKMHLAEEVFELGLPILGICYGMQIMAAQFGGEVKASAKREYGHASLNVNKENALLPKQTLNVWMSHGDKVESLPEGFEIIASSNNAPIAAISHKQLPFFGLQFHPEVTHTEQGKTILSQFVRGVCDCQAEWTAENIIEASISEIQKTVGDEKVILGLSGGVDSSVAAALLHRAIGDQLTCIFVDNGLLRLNEQAQVKEVFSQHMGLNVIYVDASDLFYEALAGVADPEQKRKIAGKVFIDVFDQQAEKLSGVKFLAQGTIYPDVIESAGAKSGKATVIKSHHNVGGLPEDMKLSLIEPLRELFKDEVREIGTTLGLPKELVYRHPFPGPGLCVRILGEVKPEYARILRLADAIFIEELHQADLYYQVAQAFAVFLPVKSVGVIGDGRQYEYVVALRAVKTVDFMTAHYADLPHEFLGRVANRIINEVPGISRVAYDISGKPPATIEWE